MMGLTVRQAEVVAFVQDRIGRNGIAPSYEEIAAKLGVRSRGNVNRLVNELVERGALVRLPGKAKSLALPESIGAAWVLKPLPELRRAIEAYATKHNISIETACHEALRSYFVEAAAQ